MRMRLGKAARLFGVVATAAFISLAAVAIVGLSQIRVGGPVYSDVIASKDLVADVLPPPLYAIEAMLEASLAHAEPGTATLRGKRLAKLKDEFYERLAYWRNSSLPDDLKALVEKAAAEAGPFWTAVEKELIPALIRDDQALADRAQSTASRAYALHRAAVDKLVERSKVFGETTEANAEKQTFSFSVLLYVTSGLGVLLMIGAAIVMVRGVVRPLVRLTGAMVGLARGELDTAVPHADRRDEIGEMAQAVEVFKENAVERIRLEENAAAERGLTEEERARNERARRAAAEDQAFAVGSIGRGLEQLAKGDLTFRLTDAFPADYRKLQDDFNGVMDTLQDTMKTIAGATDGIRSGTGEVSQAADDLSKRTEQQAASLEETAAALDEITATVRKTAEGANHARDVVATAKADAEHSGEVVGGAVQAMAEIDRSAKQISNIIGVIDEIAFQTNLLALNAGVEAARAGEAGKGFAVVASEVRALAQRSADAAKEIKGLIQASSGQVARGVDLVGQTGTALSRIAAQVADINAVVLEIAASAREQATGLAEVNTAVNQMDQVTQQNAAMVEQSTAASHALAQEAEQLGRLVSRFDVGEGAAAVPAPSKRPNAAKRTVTALKTVGGGHTSAVRKPEPVEEDWEAF